LEPGRGLRIAARAPDGVVEAIEWTGPEWVMAVEWHPERMMEPMIAATEKIKSGSKSATVSKNEAGIRLAHGLFGQLVVAARATTLHARSA
jgi:hypothetical protein